MNRIKLLSLFFAALSVSMDSDAAQNPDWFYNGNVDGYIDKVTANSVFGWACQQHLNQSIQVNVYAGENNQTGTLIHSEATNFLSTAAVNQVCGTGHDLHRFHISFSSEQVAEYQGQTLSAYGVNLAGEEIELQSVQDFYMPEPDANNVLLIENHFDGRQYGPESHANTLFAGVAKGPLQYQWGDSTLSLGSRFIWTRNNWVWHTLMMPDVNWANHDLVNQGDVEGFSLIANYVGDETGKAYSLGLGAPRPTDFFGYWGHEANIYVIYDQLENTVELKAYQTRLAVASLPEIQEPIFQLELRVTPAELLPASMAKASAIINGEEVLSEIVFEWQQLDNYFYINGWDRAHAYDNGGIHYIEVDSFSFKLLRDAPLFELDLKRSYQTSRGTAIIDLVFPDAPTETVNIYRDEELIKTHYRRKQFRDRIRNPQATEYEYKVCDSEGQCSNILTVSL